MAQAPEDIRPLPRLPSIAETEESTFRSDGASLVSDSQRTSTDTPRYGARTVSGRVLLALGKPPFNLLSTLFMISLCKWPREEARLILLALVRSLPEVTQPPGWKSERLYDLMVAIIEVQELEGWGSFIVEAAILLDKTCPPTRSSLIRIMFRPHLPQTLTMTCTFTAAKHLCDFLVIIFQITGEYIPRDIAQAIKGLTIGPVYIIVSQIVEETEVTPLSKLQVHGRRGRANTWMVLQTHGLRLETRISQIERILSETLKVSNHQIFDAVADASIFIRYYTAFYHELKRRVVMREQLPMNDLDRIATLLSILYNPPSSQKIVWPRQHKM
ncbi:hypothetical protein B0H14DRAFT_2910188 [Mycena olivaceomarginata]|nr:hypothetical protein B0H14DRAFT_2910188 [Mycena olivaceomarginata]